MMIYPWRRKLSLTHLCQTKTSILIFVYSPKKGTYFDDQASNIKFNLVKDKEWFLIYKLNRVIKEGDSSDKSIARLCEINKQVLNYNKKTWSIDIFSKSVSLLILSYCNFKVQHSLSLMCCVTDTYSRANLSHFYIFKAHKMAVRWRFANFR